MHRTVFFHFHQSFNFILGKRLKFNIMAIRIIYELFAVFAAVVLPCSCISLCHLIHILYNFQPRAYPCCAAFVSWCAPLYEVQASSKLVKYFTIRVKLELLIYFIFSLLVSYSIIPTIVFRMKRIRECHHFYIFNIFNNRVFVNISNHTNWVLCIEFQFKGMLLWFLLWGVSMVFHPLD